MGTLGGFPNPPALWLRRAKLACANAIDGNGRGRASRKNCRGEAHFVSLCSVCLRHLLQNFDSLSFSAFARLFFVLE
jgi:hypothetical protein